MNETINLLKAHRSIRSYKSVSIPEEHLLAIISSAQAASTSSNIQAYSVIAIKQHDKKKQLAALAGNQAQIEQCSVFLVWLADFHKINHAVHLHEGDDVVQNTETFLLATIDATLAAQNAAIAAESLGYGIVYIGGIRNNPQPITELLQLPKYVYPVFGLCIGVPNQNPEVRPRLPIEAILHEEHYHLEQIPPAVNSYDQFTHHYYATRSGNADNRVIDTTWTKEIKRRFSGGKLREHMYSFLEEQGFKLK